MGMYLSEAARAPVKRNETKLGAREPRKSTKKTRQPVKEPMRFGCGWVYNSASRDFET